MKPGRSGPEFQFHQVAECATSAVIKIGCLPAGPAIAMTAIEPHNGLWLNSLNSFRGNPMTQNSFSLLKSLKPAPTTRPTGLAASGFPLPRSRLICLLFLGLLLVSAQCDKAQKDGLPPEEVANRLMDGLLANDSEKAKKYVTDSSTIILTVVMKLISHGEEAASQSEKADTNDLKTKLRQHTSNMSCKIEAQLAECSFLSNEIPTLPLQLTDEGWRVDLWLYLKRIRARTQPTQESI